MDNINIHDLRVLSVVASEKNEIWFLLPTRDDNYSLILIYDYLHGSWIKRKSQKLSSLAIVDNVFYSAGKNKVYEEYVSDLFDNEFIESFYKCSPFNLSADNTMKILYIPPRITLDMGRSNDFMVQYVKNYDSIKPPKIKHIKNLFYWDLSFWDSFAIYKPKESNSIKKLPLSTFKTLEIKFYTQNPNQVFAIKNIEFSKIKVKQL